VSVHISWVSICIAWPTLRCLQVWYSNKNNLVNGEVTVGKAEKLNVTFTQQQLLNAKYTIPDVSGELRAAPQQCVFHCQ